uniref:Ovule protein n=1 Tax=Strongyloides venezuelensis TaxID=75913 RepID=A0A0K0FL85_STRVS
MIIFSKSRKFQNKYKPRERSFQAPPPPEENRVSSSNDVEAVRDDSHCQDILSGSLNIGSLDNIQEKAPSSVPVDISMLESLDILHIGNLDTVKLHRSYSDQCFHISSYLINFEFQDDIQHHLSSTRRNPPSFSSYRNKQKLKRCNTSGNGSLDLQSSFVKEFEADLHTRLCSTRRSSTSLTLPNE